MDKLILSYHDTCLYDSDYAILKSDTDWISDRIISFYFEYLQREVYENDQVLFIGPEVTQAIKLMQTPADVNEIFLIPLSSSTRSFIIFAVNDHTAADKAGGSHWSLCVYSRVDNLFFHFDSSSTSNFSACSRLVKILRACLGCKTAEIFNVPCLQQNNCYDCGVFVLCHTDLVCRTIAGGESLKAIKKVEPNKIRVKRDEVIQITKSLNK